jgi:Sec-independent protein translocase protein TatA
MLAFFGLGIQELLLLAIVGLLIFVPVILLLARTAGGSSSRVRELEDENRRLRERLDGSREGE